MPGKAWAAANARSGVCVSAPLCICCLILAFYIPSYIDKKLQAGIRGAIVWQPSSPEDVDRRFRMTPSNDTDTVPDYLRLWAFNISNIQDVRQGAKPHLVEVGPFTYIKRRIRVDVWWDRAGRVSVKEYDYHTLVPEMSVADPHIVNITTINVPLLGVVEGVRATLGPAAQRWLGLLGTLVEGMKIPSLDGAYMTRSAHDLLWGYEDEVLHRLAKLLPPGVLPTTRFELIHNMTDIQEAYDRPATIINTDVHDISKVWNYEVESGWTNVTSWNNCTEPVRGTDAFQFRPGIKPTDNLTVWIAELYRSANIIFEEEVSMHGVRLLRYGPDPSQTEPDACHYQQLRGLMNITIPTAVGPNGNPADAAGPPIYVSMPHFCLADPVLAGSVDGLNCNVSIHRTMVDVEPITGISMRAHKRLQLSTQLTAAALTTLEPKPPPPSPPVPPQDGPVTPLFWAEEYSMASERQANDLKGSVYRAMNLASSSHVFLLTLSLVSGACTVACMVLLVMRPAEDQPPAPRGVRTGVNDVRQSPEASDTTTPLLTDSALHSNSHDGEEPHTQDQSPV